MTCNGPTLTHRERRVNNDLEEEVIGDVRRRPPQAVAESGYQGGNNSYADSRRKRGNVSSASQMFDSIRSRES